MNRLYAYYFIFGRLFMIRAGEIAHADCRPYARTREQAAALVRLGSVVRVAQ